MKILLDTCTFLWLQLAPSRIPASLLQALASRDNEIYLSAASAWEIVLKWSAQRLQLPAPAHEFVLHSRRASDIGSVAIGEAATLQLSKLPSLHKDPFDRILIAQAIELSLPIATPDPLIRQYPVRTLWD